MTGACSPVQGGLEMLVARARRHLWAVAPLPPRPFFGVVAAALKPGGTLLVSHTDRGIVSMDEAIQHAQTLSLSWTAEASGGKGGGLGESITCHTFEKEF